jgi:hypothetical protein
MAEKVLKKHRTITRKNCFTNVIILVPEDCRSSMLIPGEVAGESGMMSPTNTI